MNAGWIALAWLVVPHTQEPPQFGLSDLERASGWVSMSDEEARASWGAPVKGWTFEGSMLKRAANTTERLGWNDVLSEFEIEFEWRDHRAADNAWHPGRVVMRRDNSALALLAEQRIDRAADSDMPSFRAGPFELTPAQSKPGWHIALLPGESEFELRGMRLRDRTKAIGKEVELCDGKTLNGWRALGDAKWSVVDGELVGEVGGGSQSFLATEKSFGDFIFEVDVKNNLPGNSGIQVRSHENEQKRLFGYQIEIDPSPRAWSGGLYDEARRGWLDDLSDNPHGRAAFKSGEWNHYRIECIGTWIRAWVNDVPTADYVDGRDLQGMLGLQVHAGKDTKIRWRNFRLALLEGLPTWTDITKRVERQRCKLGDDSSDLRMRFRTSGGGEIQPDRTGESLTLNVHGWSKTIPLETSTAATCEVLILRSSPHLEVEVDGRRLPPSPWTPPSESKPRTGFSVSWEGPMTIDSIEELEWEIVDIVH